MGGNEFNLGHFEFEAFVTHVNGTVPLQSRAGAEGLRELDELRGHQCLMLTETRKEDDLAEKWMTSHFTGV